MNVCTVSSSIYKVYFKINKDKENRRDNPKWTLQRNWQNLIHKTTKHTHKTKDRVTRIPLKTGGELRCSGRVSSSSSTSDTRRVNLVTNPVISHERRKDREVLTTSGTYPWSFVTQIFHSGQPSHGGDRKTFEGTRNALLSSWLNYTEVYLTPFISTYLAG